jgi:hypothetical protein
VYLSHSVDEVDTRQLLPTILYAIVSCAQQRVECHDVDTTHPLRNHDCEGGKSRAANARNSEKLNEASNVIVCSNDGSLLGDLDMNAVKSLAAWSGVFRRR